jgi:hypothetical protein
MLSRLAWAVSAGCIAGSSAWASFEDDKAGLTVVSAAFAAVLGAFAPSFSSWVAARGVVGPSELDEAALGLAVKVLDRVRTSSLRVRLHRPTPLQVRFRSAVGVGASRSAVMGVDDVASWELAPLAGDLAAVSERLRGLRWRQLVVVGEPGAGKSVLVSALVDQLLSTRRASEAIPVLVGVSSWNPRAESLTQFVARRLVEDFGVLARLASRLVSEPRVLEQGGVDWWVMPVLDGLDEIDARWHVDAMNALEVFTGSDRPVVVTCRAKDFARAEAVAGALSRAAVVRLDPLQVADVVRFLSFPDARAGLWEPVFAALRSQPAGPLAQTLSTPLMAGLAKDVYSNADPGVLVGSATNQEIISRLIDGYVSSVYQTPVGGNRFRPQDATRWLGSLAYLAYLDGTRDLRWWRLPWEQLGRRPGLIVWMRVVVVAVVAGALSAWWSSRGHAVLVGAAAGTLAAACVSGMFDKAFEHELQQSSPVTPRGLRWLVRWTDRPSTVVATVRAAFGGMAGVVTGIASGDIGVGLTAGVVCGLLPGLTRVLRWRPALLGRRGPVDTLRAIHVHTATAAVAYGLLAGAVVAGAAALRGNAVSESALPAAVVFGGAAGLAGGAGTWLRFRLTQLGLALPGLRGHESLLPIHIIALLKDGTHPDRATVRVNGTAWQFRHAVIQDRLLEHVRPRILRRQADAGSRLADGELAGLLREQGSLDELRRRAGAGSQHADKELSRLLREQGNIDELRRRADAGSWDADDELAGLLREQGNADELRRRADAGSWHAAVPLAGLLREQGSLDEAARVLRRSADAGQVFAAEALAILLREQGNVDELRRRSEAGDGSAVRALAELLREQGSLDEAAGVLRRSADAGDLPAGRVLSRLLREQSNVDELRRRADAGSWDADDELAGLLREQGNADELRRRAETGSWHAAVALAGLLREQGSLDEAAGVLRRSADAGNGSAGRELASLLREQGNLDGAAAVLRRRADAGDRLAARELASLLREQGNFDEAAVVLSRADDVGAVFRWMTLRRL